MFVKSGGSINDLLNVKVSFSRCPGELGAVGEPRASGRVTRKEAFKTPLSISWALIDFGLDTAELERERERHCKSRKAQGSNI